LHAYIPETIGGRIRLMREKAYMTRTALAKLCHVDRRTVATWENDERFPKSCDIQRLSEIFGKSCDYIIIGK
jgi:transcriptional regulator with XRE-family HTH domain